MKTNLRRVLILAAGSGKRLKSLTASRPKCLVKIGGYPILFYQLRALETCGIKDIVMVTGYRASMIEKYVANNFPELHIQFIRNPHYQSTDKLYSWLLTKDIIRESLLSMDSDIIFHPAIISAALSMPRETNAALFCRRKCVKDETKVGVDSDGMIMNIGKDLKPGEISGKFTGIYVFSKNFSRSFFTAAGKLLNSQSQPFMKDATEYTIRKIMDEQNLLFHGLDVSQYPFAEIDSPRDLRIAEAETLPGIVSAIFNWNRDW